MIKDKRTPRTDLENELADKEFAKEYRDARIKSSWEIKMVEEMGYVKPPKPDGRLLTGEEIHVIFLSHYTKRYGKEAAKELLSQLLPDCNYAKEIAKAQRDLTASIKDAWYNALLEEFKRVKIDRARLMDEFKVKEAEIAELNEALDYMVESYEVMAELYKTECQQRVKQERERIMKIFASFDKIQLKKPLSGKEFEALFD